MTQSYESPSFHSPAFSLYSINTLAALQMCLSPAGFSPESHGVRSFLQLTLCPKAIFSNRAFLTTVPTITSSPSLYHHTLLLIIMLTVPGRGIWSCYSQHILADFAFYISSLKTRASLWLLRASSGMRQAFNRYLLSNNKIRINTKYYSMSLFFDNVNF